ncbi:MAG: hypothetical protein AAB920_01495 [Patescibacteria group bacterium]
MSPRKRRSMMKANPYRFDVMGSFGDAELMLLRQFQFPNEYEEREKVMSADHDRCLTWDYEHTRLCFMEYTGTGELGFEYWVHTANDEDVIKFLKDILKADEKAVWTGYRVLGTVNRSNGYHVWSLQLFAKHPDSKTKVYSGPDAPNVNDDPRIPNGSPRFIFFR